MGNCVSVPSADAWPGGGAGGAQAPWRAAPAPFAPGKGALGGGAAGAAAAAARLRELASRITGAGGRLRDSAHSFGAPGGGKPPRAPRRGGAGRGRKGGGGGAAGGSATGAALAALARACGTATAALRLPAIDLVTGGLRGGGRGF
jgi:hypothetical protein